jgi:hypothetical protein
MGDHLGQPVLITQASRHLEPPGCSDEVVPHGAHPSIPSERHTTQTRVVERFDALDVSSQQRVHADEVSPVVVDLHPVTEREGEHPVTVGRRWFCHQQVIGRCVMLVSLVDGVTVDGPVARSGQIADRPLDVAGQTPVVGQQLGHL